jgi:hypothetical protein
MERTTLTPEESAELQRLQREYDAATARQAAIISTHGMTSPEFLDLERVIGDISRRIREIRRIPPDQDWRAW